MSSLTLVTLNPNKAAEIAAILVGADVTHQALDIPEIQSFDLQEIVRTKTIAAFGTVGTPVLVEDTTLEIEALKGFPGPFVKFWVKHVGCDLAAEITEKLGNDRVHGRCGVGYYDGKEFVYVEAAVHGRFVSRRGDDGWDFDFYFIQDGYDRTYAELGREIKNKISHRKLAWEAMREKLLARKII